ncbi:MAG: type III-B CRISPR module RAMP protein Cmr1 [Acidobacteria bacterium]|nr:type III-B CRISPR module RAMP protein Cmr1 [Acidobacteriota bacterium]
MRRPPKDKQGREITAPPTVTPNLGSRRNSAGEKVELVRQVREYELITPLYGGGVEPAHADPLTTVRVPGIRGHLRFWWRACRATQFSTVAEMKREEDSIWGSTEQPSAVVLELKLDDKAAVKKEPAYWMERNPRTGRPALKNSHQVHTYAAFPLQPKKEEREQAGWKSGDILTGVCFSLRLSFPGHLIIPRAGSAEGRKVDVKKEVEAALWAWETFGGVGARTRRGFGALVLRSIDGEKVPPTQSRNLGETISRKLGGHVLRGDAPEGIPHLKTDMSVFGPLELAQAGARESAPRPPHDMAVCLTPLAPGGIDKHPELLVWSELIEKLRDFRQCRSEKEAGEYPPRGHSYWPEPRMIKKLLRREKEPLDVEKFPRAEFGLPIIFHMPRLGDLEATLKGLRVKEADKDFERLASRLILRPLRCADGAVGVALILEAPRTPPGGLMLSWVKDRVTAREPVDSQLSEDEAAELTHRLEPLGGRTDVLQAFLQYLTVRRSQR